MGATESGKTGTHDEQVGVARRFFAASDPTRVRILSLLAGGERCVCELVDALDAAQPRLSFHLRTLRDAGLVHDRRRGRWIYYSLNTDVLESMSDQMMEWSESARQAGDPVCGCGGTGTGCC